MTCVYGWPQTENKHLTWKLLCKLNEEKHEGWICIGDISQVLAGEDKEGGLPSDFTTIYEFRRVMD